VKTPGSSSCARTNRRSEYPLSVKRGRGLGEAPAEPMPSKKAPQERRSTVITVQTVGLTTDRPENRSADFQSAVSPISNRQGAGKSQRARTGRRPAEYKSAIRQSATLRYELCRPSCGPSSNRGVAVFPGFLACVQEAESPVECHRTQSREFPQRGASGSSASCPGRVSTA